MILQPGAILRLDRAQQVHAELVADLSTLAGAHARHVGRSAAIRPAISANTTGPGRSVHLGRRRAWLANDRAGPDLARAPHRRCARSSE